MTDIYYTESTRYTIFEGQTTEFSVEFHSQDAESGPLMEVGGMYITPEMALMLADLIQAQYGDD